MQKGKNTFFMILIIGLLALFAFIEFMPMEDYQRLKGGRGVEAAPTPRPTPKGTPRKLTPEEQRDGVNRRKPIANG